MVLQALTLPHSLNANVASLSRQAGEGSAVIAATQLEQTPRPTKWGEAGSVRVQRMLPVRGGDAGNGGRYAAISGAAAQISFSSPSSTLIRGSLSRSRR